MERPNILPNNNLREGDTPIPDMLRNGQVPPRGPNIGCIAFVIGAIVAIIIGAIVIPNLSSGTTTTTDSGGSSSSTDYSASNGGQGTTNPPATYPMIPTDLPTPTETSTPIPTDTPTPVPTATATPLPLPQASGVPQDTVVAALLSQINASSYSPYTVVAYNSYPMQVSPADVFQDTCMVLNIPSYSLAPKIWGEVVEFDFERDKQTWGSVYTTQYYDHFDTTTEGANWCSSYIPYSDRGSPQYTP